MKKAVYSCVAGFAVAAPSPDVVAKFHEFRTKWSRGYLGEEYVKRVKYFEDHLRQVESLQRQEQGTATYTYFGPFADLSEAEMNQRFGLLPQEDFEQIQFAPLFNKTLGHSFDWVSRGAVNPVKDQGQCGSCWSFSTACNLEGTGFVTTGKLVSLSEQNIMDCDKTCYSCNGGLPSLALTWSSQNGVASEASYPYRAHDESCNAVRAIAHNKGYVKISHNEDQIAQALTHYGPLSIGVDATPFQSYNGGVMNNPACSKTRLDHAVNIVGYGVDQMARVGDQIEYWKIRNSWSANWGEAGYIRVSRGHNTCGLANMVVTATGVSIISDHTGPAHAVSIPTQPGLEPPPAPSGCTDSIANCPYGGWECELVAADCRKSCGCCGANIPHPPSFCGVAAVSSKASAMYDEFKKLVCKELERKGNEETVEKLICDDYKYKLEVEGCDKIVDAMWKMGENRWFQCEESKSSLVV